MRLVSVLLFSLVAACSSSPSTEPVKPADEKPAAADATPADADSGAEAAPTPAEDVDSTPTVTFFTEGGEVMVAVEIADTQALRIKGMMFRETVEPDRGMVFVFAEEVIHPFWMKNTYVSLDMIHVGAGMEVVGIVPRAEPLSLDRRAIDKPSRYVVEVAAGYAEERGIVPGTRVSFANVPSEPKD